MSVKVKICGITTPKQAEEAQIAGADAIGIVLHESSVRHVEFQLAKDIISTVNSEVMSIVLVVNASPKDIYRTIEHLNPNFLQFHGDESPEFCNQFNFPFIRAIRMRRNLNLVSAIKSYQALGGFLFDAWDAKLYGGTGVRFDWSRLPRERNFPLTLAGGLTCENVQHAITAAQPDMVDVSGGVESSPGIKDPYLIELFVEKVKG
ncbi:MAG: N-(5'-phosphoribosyl)anthranilate isomerase [Cellvibrionales bacterium TMED49]|nr:phosphoribosylanthranilate isomerase [Porticoccaceae bacterium]OUU37024.1 MAG: N-(5'-phosphoribosyl)anthranilate isomerase [Cellvibrionales bacterium TMED49]